LEGADQGPRSSRVMLIRGDARGLGPHTRKKSGDYERAAENEGPVAGGSNDWSFFAEGGRGEGMRPNRHQ